MNSLFKLLRTFYWKLNRPFLEKFSESLVGQGQQEELQPDGKVIFDSLMTFLNSIPGNAYQQITVAFILLPLAVPAKFPRINILRLLVKVWMVIAGHFKRRKFISMSQQERAEFLDCMFERLASNQPEELDDLVKMTVVLNIVKLIITTCYMETHPVWKGLDYSPYPVPPRTFSPPSGTIIENPPQTETSKLLHDSAVSAQEICRKDPDRNNYCVIGSGAGGAVAALFILKEDPKARVVILEEGPLVTNEAFPTRLLDATAKLYMNTGLTLSKNMLYTFRQGRCVGGSTTLNNGVAYQPKGFWWKQNIVERWQLLGVEMDFDELNHAYEDIVPLINVHPLEERVITSAAQIVADGFAHLGYEANTLVVPTNTKDCIGCGRCNAGCQYDAKQSMLITAIPEVVKNGGYLVPDAKVSEIIIDETGESWDVRGVVVETLSGEKVKIEADKFVLAAGAYASTKLLWKSGFTGVEPGVRTVGKRFTGNMGTPVVGLFSESLKGWAGQQCGFAVELPDIRCVIETGFGPPALIGLEAPQWGDKFMRLVESYNRMAVAIPVIAGMDYGEVDRGFLPTTGWFLDYRLGGFVIDYSMGVEDWLRLIKAMKLAAHAMFAMGAEEVFDTRFNAKSLRDIKDLDSHFDGIGPSDYIKVETAHLHGGNVISRDPSRGVVDGDLKVHGFNNLWICDGSVIPAAITLNLQMTIMALARYAAPRIVAFQSK